MKSDGHAGLSLGKLDTTAREQASALWEGMAPHSSPQARLHIPEGMPIGELTWPPYPMWVPQFPLVTSLTHPWPTSLGLAHPRHLPLLGPAGACQKTGLVE